MTDAYNLIQDYARIVKSPEPDDLAHDVVEKLLKNKRVLNKPDNEVRNFVFMMVRNKHLDNCKLKKNKVDYPVTLVATEEKGKFEDLCKVANLTEIEGYYLEAYMDFGDISKIARKFNVKRHHVDKRIKQIFEKCRPYKHLL